jgi:hypothetical protein
LQAKPNPGHYALTELAKKVPDFITLTQNVDGGLYSHLLNSTRQVTCGCLTWFPLFTLSTGETQVLFVTMLDFRYSSKCYYINNIDIY